MIISGMETVKWAGATTKTFTSGIQASDVINMREKGNFYAIATTTGGTGHDTTNGSLLFVPCDEDGNTPDTVVGATLDTAAITTAEGTVKRTTVYPAVGGVALYVITFLRPVCFMKIAFTNGDVDKNITVQVDLYYEMA
jgi:hypothetical protein